MASFMLDVRPFGTRKAEATLTHRIAAGLHPASAHRDFPTFVADVANKNGWIVMAQSPIDATFRRPNGTTPCAYAMIETATPPSAAEPNQKCRRALKGAGK